MQRLQKKVICLVESGWEGIRNLTIALAKEKVLSECIIKGKLEKEVLEMIKKYDEIFLSSIRRGIFKLYIFLMFLGNFILQNTVCIVMDSQKNYSWVRAINRVFGIKTLLLVEKDHDYMLFEDGRPQDIKLIFNLCEKSRDESRFNF